MRLHALLEHAAFEELLDGELVHDFDELREGDVVEPVSVEPDLRRILAIEVENLGELSCVRLGVFEHLRVSEALSGFRAIGRVADAPGEVADQENDVMAVKLEPAEDSKAHQVTDVHVGARRIKSLVDGEPLAPGNVVEELVADYGVVEHAPVEERLQVPVFHIDSPQFVGRRVGQ